MKEFAHKAKENPKVKALILWALIPKNQARPRWWVKNFVNPFIHKRGKNSLIRKNTRMDLLPFREFTIGQNSTIEDFSVVNNGMGAVKIGDGVRIGLSNVVIGPVNIGNHVIIAQNVVMSGLNHGYQDIGTPICKQPCSTSEIKIEDECWIGANSVLTAGVTIGKHSIIAAGTIITKDVPPYSVVAGNPGKVIKQYNQESKSWERVTETALLKKVS